MCERTSLLSAMCKSQRWDVRPYWPVLGLVVGPGCVPGVGLVVLGVSVPMPPALEPEVDAPPDMSDELPDDDAPPVLLPLLSEGIDDDDSLDVPRLPDMSPELMPELPPDMPAHAPSSIAHAMGNSHFVIDHSCWDQKAVRTRCAPENALRMQRVETEC
jgi:hypothetical protein